jgi:hypothetical protein
VHTTYQFSQARGKRQRLREHGLWTLDDDAYYEGRDVEGNEGFVTLAPGDAPPRALLASGPSSHHSRRSPYDRVRVVRAVP